ncbi:hypothetical protein DNJ95_10970 [Stutzerimonas kirkiae]|uniref:Secretin/TonB short N-terminal domain-containing protein n=1 Tax=Stutzerimonas kirkiae TaxID=2211392 RepID=A0A4V2KCK5_9GAMM|nr:hypothetical protein DNJ96_12740 [Stutzerimonas kirkiae]TBV01857.1 hypothetical protein DNJ95_10970 [Stutzerimonas kirkiae]
MTCECISSKKEESVYKNPSAKRLHRLALGISLALLAPTNLMAATSTENAYLEQRHHFNIAPQSLPDALLSFTQQAGLRLSFDSGLIPDDTPSPGLHGEMSVQSALTRLLAGLNLTWERQGDGSLMLLRGPEQAQSVLLQNTLVVDHGALPQGNTRYDSEHLQSMPIRQGQITEALRQHPAVSFDRNSLSSKTPADLAAENVSINGAKYWDNRFSVDGVSMNNDINPGGRTVAANSSFTDLPANTSQGMNLDISLLQSLEVYDSNVPAEYGGFTGGVIDAQTRQPKRELSGSLSMSIARDSWTEYHIDDRYRDDFYDSGAADGNADSQPKFRTLTYRATLEGHPSENLGLIGSVVRRQSDIQDKNIYARDQANNGVSAPTRTDLAQTIDNLFLKGVWQVSDRLTLGSTLNYAPQEAEYFNINTLDGSFEMESGGLQTIFNADWQGGWGTWHHILGWSELEQSRQKGADYFKAWYYSADKDWADPTQRWNAAMEGSYGNIEQTQKRLGYDLKLDLQPFQFATTQHNVKLGVNLDRTKASYGRDKEYIQANGVDLIATGTCTTASGRLDSEYCSASPVLANPFTPWADGQGQMFRRLYYYVPGEIEAEQDSLAVFVDDSIQWRNLSVRAGLRAERNDFAQDLNLAPRLVLSWDVLGNGGTRLIAGANRYYGRDIFDVRLRQGREGLRYYALRDTATLEFGERVLAARNTTNLADLKTPYDDELTLGIEQVFFDTLFALRYVQRNGEDQLHRRPASNDGSRPDLATTYYEYTNDGSTDSKHYYLTITPLRTLSLYGTHTDGSLSFSWSDIESSNRSYDDDFDETLVLYKGKPIRAYEIPVDNFTRPWSARLVASTRIPALNLTLGNFINWRDGYSQVIRNGRTPYQGQNIYNYVEKDIGSALTWDMRAGWELPLGKTEAAFVNLDVGNLLNRRNTIGSSSSTSLTAEIDYELGRNYTLEVGYRF